MRAFYEARVEHLSAADRVKVECMAKLPSGEWCNRTSLISVKGLGLPGNFHIKNLERRLKCENCGARGRVSLSIVWA